MFRKALFVAYAVVAGLYLYVLAAGWSFYVAPLPSRAHHPGYWTFKPGGSVGHVLGLAGSACLILLLGYSLRKRMRRLRRLGPVTRWLDLHIFLGLVGPLLIVLHSTFRVSGLVALSFWSMVLVALSGVLGRYLYLQIPRARNGEALTLAETERLDRALSQRLREEFRLDEDALKRLEQISTPRVGAGFGAFVLYLTTDYFQRSRALRRFARQSRHLPHPLVKRFVGLVRLKNATHRRLVLWDRFHELFHYWYVIHKPFAVVMYLFMFVHIAVTLALGYGWGWIRP